VRNVYIVFSLPCSDECTAFNNKYYYFEVLLSAVCKEFYHRRIISSSHIVDCSTL